MFIPMLILATSTSFSKDLLAADEQPALTLKTFLAEVAIQHDGIKASAESIAGAEIKKSEGDVLISPQLTASVQEYGDRRETVNPSTQGEYTR